MNSFIVPKIIQTRPYAPCLVLNGDGGSGKTTLASTFPKPLFFSTEINGVYGVDSVFLPKDKDGILSTVDFYLEVCERGEFPFKSVTTDNLSGIENVFVKHVIKTDPNKPKSIMSAHGGWEAPLNMLKELHLEYKNKMLKFRKYGITVIFIAHPGVRATKTPGLEGFGAYQLGFTYDKCEKIYTEENIDAVLFLKKKTAVIENKDGSRHLHSLDGRVIVTGLDLIYKTKNRFDMPAEIPFTKTNGFEQLKQYIPYYNQEK